MRAPDGPEERTADYEESYERDIDVLDVETQLADEANDTLWMRTSIDAIPWPTAITIRPVQVSDEMLAVARKAMRTA